jgi:hypothetical protein
VSVYFNRLRVPDYCERSNELAGSIRKVLFSTEVAGFTPTYRYNFVSYM